MACYRRAAALAAEASGVDVGDVLSVRRRKGNVADARKLAAYLAVVVFGLSRRQVARLSGRDAMRVVRSCAEVELARDDRAFDQQVCDLEARLRG